MWRGKCINWFVYRLRERERWRERVRERERERATEGGRELFHWKMLWLHLLCMSCFCIQNSSTCSSISSWKRATNHWCLINIAVITTGWFKWRLRRVHTPAAIWRLLHNILVAQESAERQQMINKGTLRIVRAGGSAPSVYGSQFV